MSLVVRLNTRRSATVLLVVMVHAATAAFAPRIADAVGGQSWIAPPPAQSNTLTLLTVDCANYAGDIEGVIGENDDFTLYLNGSTPPCGEPFNFYNALSESARRPDHSLAVWLCLSDGLVTGIECRDSQDASLVYTVWNLPPSSAAGILAYKPEVAITAPRDGDAFSGAVAVAYSATDKNDTIGGLSSQNLGLGSDAASIFYLHDAEGDWYAVARDRQPRDTYLWPATELTEGPYRVRVVVKDKGGEQNETISGVFFIDRTPPLFDVSVEPPFSKGERVTITVTATEPLIESPDITVTQRQYAAIPVAVAGEGRIWKGTYEVRPGFDGTAAISVSGKDRARNVGTLVRSGGSFSVGIAPPPSPVITGPLNNDIVATSSVTVSGKIREDTRAAVSVNGVRVGVFAPDVDGYFTAAGIALSKDFNNGANIIRITSEDPAGNASEAAVLTVKYNIPPTVSIVEPAAGAVLDHTAAIVSMARDENNDSLTLTYEISADGGATWRMLASTSKRTYQWNTRTFPDGEYILRVRADDGIAPVFATSSSFIVQNFLPKIVFAVPVSATNRTSVIVRGLAGAGGDPAKKIGARLVVVEYSIDGGAVWRTASPDDGAFNAEREAFSISLADLGEGERTIMVRAEDTEGLVGAAEHLVLVDTSSPAAPRITAPSDGAVVADSDDADPAIAGVQIAVRGGAEPASTVVVEGPEGRGEGASDAAGLFSVTMTVRRHGSNSFAAAARDAAGNTSGGAVFSVSYNNPPQLKILYPREGGGVNHRTDILFEVQDKDLDAIASSKLSYRRKGEAAARLIAENPVGGRIAWDASGLAEGLYELILEASDGVSSDMLVRTIYVDNTPPTAAARPLPKTVFTGSFVLEASGSAADNYSGIEAVEYSIDGKQWYKAVITGGYQAGAASFRIRHPFRLADGRYTLSFRSTDVAGNVSVPTPSETIVVDTTPPRIGSFMLSSGPFALRPAGGAFALLEGTDAAFRISLEEDTAEAAVYIGDWKMPLAKKGVTWEAAIQIQNLKVKSQKYNAKVKSNETDDGRSALPILVSAKDRLGNAADAKKIGSVSVVPRGRITSAAGGAAIGGAELRVYIYNIEEKSWVRWQAESYGLKNPVIADASGAYGFVLPEGRYQLRIRKPGFKNMKIENMGVASPRPIAYDFSLEPRTGIRGWFEDAVDRLFSEKL